MRSILYFIGVSVFIGCVVGFLTGCDMDVNERSEIRQDENEQYDVSYTDNEGTMAQNQPVVTKAVAVISPKSGSNVQGTITFTKVDQGIRVEADIRGLDRNARHGFHVHEYGNCSAQDGSSAGDHFNPFGMAHGGPSHEARHVGDLGNLTAAGNGRANMNMMDETISFSGLSNIIGRAVVIHKSQDDLTSQPSGAAGARIGCGVIGVTEYEKPATSNMSAATGTTMPQSRTTSPNRQTAPRTQSR